VPEIEQLRAYAGRLGIPGVVDVHVHFMPERVLRKVWHYFDTVPPEHGMAWPVHYRVEEETRVELLDALGVVAYTSLAYPHKAGMAAWLNDWCAEFASRHPRCARSATFYPEPEAAAYVKAALDAGAKVFKSHVQVGAYDPTDRLLEPVWGMLAESGTPVVCHCGSGPFPGDYTGPGPIGAVLARHPELTLVVAHCGTPEYAKFLELVERYPNVHLDTTMAFTDFLEETAPFPRDLLPRLRDAGDRVVLGTDFPNIPYPYVHQLEALERLGLGDDWLRAVLFVNGARLLGR
jgi:predicted TIM-barrel fold metal-dependent hydrolase